MTTDEKILCFERQLLDQLGLFQGLTLNIESYFSAITRSSNLTYRNRQEAESDRRFKQLIPYVILVNEDRVLRYRRGRGGGETRLHGLYSIGIGGHISDEDCDLFSRHEHGYSDGMWREVKEEVAIDPITEAAVALINDDATEVGYVHFGVVHIVRVASEQAIGYRKGIVSPEFLPIADAIKNIAEYESWSRLCLENIDRLLQVANARSRLVRESAQDCAPSS